MSQSANQGLVRGATAGLVSLALSRAEEANAKIEGHEELCAERYAHIHTAIDGVKASVATVLKILAYGGTLLLTVLISVIGFLAVRTISTNDAETERLRTQVLQLQSQRVSPAPISRLDH